VFKFKKKNIIYAASAFFLLILLSSLIPAFRAKALDISKFPAIFFTFLSREAGAVIFYHRNFRQNELLQKELYLLKHRLNAASEVYLENSRLRRLLAVKQKVSYKVIAARVIGRSADNWSSVLIIDKGASHGFKRGMAVINYFGLAGRIIETGDSTSKVMLLSDPNLGVSAIIQRSRQEGLVSGTLGNSLIMKYLPKDADIKISDTVVTSGLTDAYPKGLAIGTVMSIGDEFSGLSRYAVVKPVVNLSNIEEVLVIVSQ